MPGQPGHTCRLPRHCLIATGAGAAGHREILGVDVASSEDGAGWLALPRGLVARGLSGVAVVISDDQFAPRPAWAGTHSL